MQNYILSLILPATLFDEQIKEIVEKIKQLIAGFNGTVSEVREPERKRLAYVIKKVRNGIYTDVIFNLSKDKIKDLEKELKLNPEIIRFMILKVKEVKKEIKVKKQKTEKPETDKRERKPKKEIKMEDLDKKIDELLDEQLI